MLLAGRYALDDEPLGSGGMGEAWAAWDTELERRVAVKMMHTSPGRQPDTRVVFREARTAGRLSHPGIVTVYDVARDDTGHPFLVMELINGRDLARVLRSGEQSPVITALDWAAQVAEALRAAHAAGVVHRDLKPSNLMLTDAGSIKILDFGIAGFLDSTHTSSEVIGSAQYMAPERIDGESGDGRTDLYALGCVIYELLTGSPPFGSLGGYTLLTAHKETEPVPVRTLRSGLPAGLDELVTELLAKAPQDRPTTATDVRDRLRELIAAPSVPARRPKEPGTPVPRPLPDATTRSKPHVPASPTLPAPRTPSPSAAPTQAVPQTAPRQSAPAPRTSRRPERRRNRVLSLTVGVLVCAVVATLLVRHFQDTRKLWSTPVGTASEVVVSEGVVFLAGPEDGAVEARDTKSGDLKWTYRTGDTEGGAYPEAVADGTVYILTSHGAVHAVAAATGERHWAESAAEEEEGFAALAVAGRRVYVSSGQGVRALDTGSGKAYWRTGGGGDMVATSDTVYIAATTNEGGEEYGEEDGKVYALEGSTGKVKWTHATTQPVVSAPAVHGDTVYVGSWDNQMYALDARTGEPKWTYDASEPIGSTPYFADGILYLTTQYGTLAALDARTGGVVWSHSAPGYGGGGHAPLAVGGIVYSADSDEGHVSASDAQSGEEKWTYSIDDVMDFSDPVVAEGILFVCKKAHINYKDDDPRQFTLYALTTRP